MLVPHPPASPFTHKQGTPVRGRGAGGGREGLGVSRSRGKRRA